MANYQIHILLQLSNNKKPFNFTLIFILMYVGNYSHPEKFVQKQNKNYAEGWHETFSSLFQKNSTLIFVITWRNDYIYYQCSLPIDLQPLL
jgi:hypothetical protein